MELNKEEKEKINKAVESLKIKGYAIINNVITKERIEFYKNSIWSTMESIDNEIFSREKDYSDTKMSDLLNHKHGILESYRINHCEAAREARKDPEVLKIFCAIYGTTQLIGSLDRINFKFPGKKYSSRGRWDHIDQNPRKLGLRSIQSYLDILGTNQDEPGNRFYEGSHLLFEEFTKPFRGLDDTDWFKVDEDMRIIIEKKCKLVKPVCEPGSLVLWDSRVAHSPSEGTNFKKGRSVFYICYLPYDKSFTEKEEKKKMTAFNTMRSTQHTPYPQHMFPVKPRTYGNEMKYTEISIDHLFANRLKGKEGKEREDELKRCIEPDENEKLLFGFKSYSLLKNNIGLFNDKWNGKPLVDLMPMSVPWIPLSKKIIKKRENEKNEKKKENEKKVKKSVDKVTKEKSKRNEDIKDKDKPIKKRKLL